MELFLLGVQFAAAAMLVWACFCRLVKTNGDTCREVRWSIWLMLIAAGVVLGAPVLPILMPHDIHWEPWSTPAWCWQMLLVSTALVHLVTARAWSQGAPCGLQQVEQPRRAGAANVLLPVLGALLAVFLMVLPPMPAQAAGEAGVDVFALMPGDTIRCMHATGCVAMTSEAASELLAAAKSGVAANPCKRQSWL